MDRYIGFVLKRPKMVLLAFFVLTVILGAGMTKLQFDTTISTLLPTSDPEYKYYDRIKEIYGGCGVFVILLGSVVKLFYSAPFLKKYIFLSDILEILDFVPVL